MAASSSSSPHMHPYTHPVQLERLAKRATVGLSTAEKVSRNEPEFIGTVNVEQKVRAVQDTYNALFEAAADATEEAIYNALVSSEDMEGPGGLKVKALLDHEVLKEVVGKYL
ncbi:D-aminopeptidase [Blastomyces dermatitidis ATCC 18188]|uniref:D-aminopeptidase n=1 Tax=Ajellomyces dermatitidis (strain ATCC 18188 / CBS 674.68) TaxID=653446 RepID=F2TKS8_AJEDA|nr:D-aminopeptidase [Blastomyces dermatitidis ATCC 18188]EQL28623.1 D-aminopeptidase [Blastomyces dermatitidis ATCC 26199]